MLPSKTDRGKALVDVSRFSSIPSIPHSDWKTRIYRGGVLVMAIECSLVKGRINSDVILLDSIHIAVLQYCNTCGRGPLWHTEGYMYSPVLCEGGCESVPCVALHSLPLSTGCRVSSQNTRGCQCTCVPFPNQEVVT